MLTAAEVDLEVLSLADEDTVLRVEKGRSNQLGSGTREEEADHLAHEGAVPHAPILDDAMTADLARPVVRHVAALALLLLGLGLELGGLLLVPFALLGRARRVFGVRASQAGPGSSRRVVS